MTVAATVKAPVALRYVVVFTVIVYLASAAWHIFHGALNPDEGFYAVATRAVAQGEMPYRDFGFTQPPVVLYANSLPLRLTGFGLYAQRSVNGLWAAIALALAASWLARQTRPSWGVALVLFFATSSPWMYFVHLGKTYGFTVLLVMLSAWAFLRLKHGGWRNFVLGLLAVLGTGARLPAAPYFGLLWLFALWPGRAPSWREIGGALSGVLLGAVVVILPFWLAAADAAWFWIFEFHQISVSEKSWHLRWQEIVTLAPAGWVLGGLALGVALMRGQWVDRRIGLLAASGAALAANLLLAGVYEEYGVPFLLPLGVAAAALVWDACKDRKALFTGSLVAFMAAAQLLTAPGLFYHSLPQRRGTPSAWLPYNAPMYNGSLPAQLGAARTVVHQTLAKNAQFVGSNLILAAETGHAVPPELRMGPFAFTSEMTAERAARLHLVTNDQLDLWFADPRTTVLGFFPNSRLNYSWSMPGFALLPDDFRRTRFEGLLRNFDVTLLAGDFLLMVRKPPATR